MNAAYKIELSAMGILNYLPALNHYVREKMKERTNKDL